MKVCASGYFNPLHVGHLEYLEKAKALGDWLIVIVNSDKQVLLKGSKPFMNQADRVEIIKALECVDQVVLSIDEDKTVCKTLRNLSPDIFAKGGDRTVDNIPEKAVCEELGIKMVFGLGDKIRSSSELLCNI
jgi:rfaE bifunctional protein nucleotidyltransferase chain/domain